jgi:acyl-CoA synthetase (AMP-forming)/AMP-acid ligase II
MELWDTPSSKPALIDGVSGRPVPAGELEFATRAVASALLGMELRPGDRVLLWGAPSLRTAVISVGVLRAGLVLVPVNPALTEGELTHVINETSPAACASDTREAMRLMLELSPSMLSLETTEGVKRPGFHGLDAAKATDPALILFTSGTTGAPKGAVHSHSSLLANTDALATAWQWTPSDRLVHALPMFHAHGLCVGLLACLGVGASVVILPRFGPAEVFEAAERYNASMFFGVPTMYHRILGQHMADRLGPLRLAVSGSAPLAAALHQAIEAAGGGRVLERYGTTESLMNLSNPYAGERRPGSVGLPLPGVEVRLAGDAQADEGELLVRGPSIFSSYWGRPKARAAVVKDGWYHTGDIASMDADGYVRVLGRTTELVISGGFNVYPAEVETVLAELGGVAEVAVAGTPSDEWGEVVTAYVVPSGDTAGLVDSINQLAAERLAPYKRPRIVHLVESLPRNAMGKVVRRELGS